jgi:hypothetical protein
LSNATVSNPTASPSVTSTYILTVTNASGCVSKDTVVVNVNAKPLANAGTDQSICVGSSVSIVSAPELGNTYAWSPSAGLSNATVSNPTASPSVTSTYILTVTNASGCVSKDTVVVNVNAKPIANAGTDQSICVGSSVSIGSAIELGNTYGWSPSAGLSNATVSNPTASPIVTSTYILTITNASGCVSKDTVVVNINAMPIANAGSDQSICVGSSVSIGSAIELGNTYAWSPSAGLSNATVSNPTASPSVTSTYILTVTNASGCVSKDTVVVNINAMPIANAGTDESICVGSSVSIGSAPELGNTYGWSPSAGLSNATVSNPTAGPRVTSTYILTVTNASGCVSKDTVVVNVNAMPIANAGADQSICFGSSITIGSAPELGNTYGWSPSAGLSNATVSNPTASPSVTSTYILTVTNTSGCVSKDTVVVNVNAMPIAPIISSNATSINPGTNATINATGCAGTITWFPGNSNANPLIVNLTNTTTFTAICTVNTCSSASSNAITITVGTVVPCPNQVILISTADDYSTGVTQKTASSTSGKVIATNKITGTAKVSYKAKSIELNPGFKADGGTVFLAEVGGCN